MNREVHVRFCESRGVRFPPALDHLDLIMDLPSAPWPDSVAQRLVRATLDGLLGEPLPLAWDDQTYALKATGRVGLDGEERSALDHLAGRLPLLA